MVSEMKLKMKDKKPSCIEVTSLNGVNLTTESEVESHIKQDKSSSTVMPDSAAELTTIAPTSMDSVTGQENNNVSLCTAPEIKIDIDRPQVEVPSSLDNCSNVFFNCANDYPTSCNKTSGDSENISRTFSPNDSIIETIAGKTTGDKNCNQSNISGQNPEMIQELIDNKESQCSRNCRSCCTTFVCGLVSVGLVFLSPLIVTGYFLYELCSCVSKCKDPRPT
ncbi:uncharacterized protein LOC122556909 [Chiloscyllium plagiosum]|uniref:uncharacterized protein LOC122556909 n=1 Tax=Chiloscyllium plagiosum TaxID=36176 RepID=UPI001CB85215|nr:uncharacterized protein LOC122556909 [Chiloscyllium plagiosum]